MVHHAWCARVRLAREAGHVFRAREWLFAMPRRRTRCAHVRISREAPIGQRLPIYRDRKFDCPEIS
jgi:hypothetical protein